MAGPLDPDGPVGLEPVAAPRWSKLPAAAARRVGPFLLNAGFAEAVPAPINAPDYAWRSGQHGDVLMLRATALGIARALERDEDSGAPAPTGGAAGCSAETTEVQ